MHAALTMPSATELPPNEPSSGVRARAARILVVEDEADCRELFAEELRRAGFVVYKAADGNAGIAMTREHDPDVIVLDLMLPDVNGITVAQVARDLKGIRGARILVVSALTSAGMRRTAEAVGCHAFIAKPTTAAAVVDEVHRLLGRRSGHQAAQEEGTDGSSSSTIAAVGISESASRQRRGK